MELFVGRQPIFNCHLRPHGCELLFRPGPVERYGGAGENLATSQVIANTLLSLGLDEVLRGVPGFINPPVICCSAAWCLSCPHLRWWWRSSRR